MADAGNPGEAGTPPPAAQSPDKGTPNVSEASPSPGTGTPPGESRTEGAPEQYVDFIAPEGVALNADLATDFKATAKELNLSQAAAQKLVDVMAPKIAKQQQDQMAKVVQDAQAQWTEEAKKDPEYGGAAFEENLAVARRALDTYGSKELSSLLASSGLGSHPEVVRFFVRAGKPLSPDGKLVTGTHTAAEKTPAQKLYG